VNTTNLRASADGRRGRLAGAAATAVAIICLACTLAAPRQAHAFAENYESAATEEVIRVEGDSADPVMLQVFLYSPRLPGPHPLAVVNHGSSADSEENRSTRHVRMAALYFLSRGYTVAVPMMRGYGDSPGHWRGAACDLAERGNKNARDIMAVVDHLAQRGDIDTTRVVMAGQSYGGWNALAVGKINPANVKGLINLAGAIGNGTCPRWQSELQAAAADLGRATEIPSLWFYGDNDSVNPVALWRSMFERYSAGQRSPSAELVAFGKFMGDAHYLQNYPEAMPILFPRLDAFLAKIDMPNALIYPQVLPRSFPPASDYAAVESVEAIPYIGDSGRQAYRDFLGKAFPRAFVISTDGLSLFARGGFDPISAALEQCAQTSKSCQVYAVDDRVVWKRPTPAPAASGYANLNDIDAIPYLKERGRDAYRKYLTLRKPKVFIVTPDGGFASYAGGEDPLQRARQDCAAARKACQPYAVDDDVVWQDKR
jgi:pimeloyl-ACP methyl ester carboxylesterase